MIGSRGDGHELFLDCCNDFDFSIVIVHLFIRTGAS